MNKKSSGCLGYILIIIGLILVYSIWRSQTTMSRLYSGDYVVPVRAWVEGIIGLALAIFGFLSVAGSGDGGSKGNKTSKSGKPLPDQLVPSLAKRSYIKRRDGSEAITSYGGRKVYYGATNTVYGHYDAKGNVYNRDNKLIGYIMTGGSEDTILMDRTYNYQYLQEHLRDDPALKDASCKPAMRMSAGINWYTWIEAAAGGVSVHIMNRKEESMEQTVLGSSAAYLVAVNDGLINQHLDQFYLTSNIQKECYFKAKNKNNPLAYVNYFEQLYGQRYWD